MKKLYLLAAAGLTALSMNAQLYVVGNGASMTWDLPGQEIQPNEDGTYTLNLSACDQFKVSKNYSTEWDGDGSFNAGAFTPDNATHGFTNAVFNEGGETVATTNYGENISLPANGRYTITINADCTEMTAVANFARPVNAPDVYVRGAMNGWGSPDAWKFTNVSYDPDNSTGEWTLKCQITAGIEFKIADSTWGNINYTTTDQIVLGKPLTLAYNISSNMKLAQDFNGTITFKITGPKQATAIFTQDSEGPVYPDNLFIIGTINGQAWDPANVAPMTSEGDGIYTISAVKLGENGGSCGFAITGGGSTWEDVNALRFGPMTTDTPAQIGENPVDGMGDLSWSIAPGSYDMTFDYTERTLTIEKANGSEGPDVPVTPGDGVIYLLGQGDGLNWDLPGKKIEKGADGNYTFTVSNLAYFKFSTIEATEWDGDNGFNAHAYATGTTTFGDEVANEGGQTLPIEPWGENQELPWTGDYTITISGDFTTMTAYTTTPKPVGAPVVYIRGAMNGWLNDGLSDTWKMTYIEENQEYTFVCTGETMLPAESEFKFADSNWSAVNFGNGNRSIEASEEGVEEVLNKGGENMAMSMDFIGTITLKIEGAAAVATFKTDSGNSAVTTIVLEDGETVYYNLQGQKVVNPDKGIYIKVAGGKASKIVK